jgi:glutaconate CoA-transferase subunit A|tara:strand:- start:972 stop:1856 length:885 start_codon:yes stop_codon:yes gene_type:complete
MIEKISNITEAIKKNINDNDTIFIGGFGHLIPFYLTHELIRQNKADLTICRSGADILFDQLIASKIIKKVIFGYIGNPSVGLSHSFNRAYKSDIIEVEEWTNQSMILRLHAARMGVSYLPSKILQIGDKPSNINYLKSTICPYTGDLYSAIPSLKPDVALIHAQNADKYGNIQMWGIDGDTIEGALASDKIIVSVEKIINNEKLKEHPEMTVIPAHRVTSVIELPWGAYPSYVSGYYSRDDDHYMEYDQISRDEEKLLDYLDEWVHSSKTLKKYQEMIGKERCNSLEKGQCGKK